jgi:hypothetical protein
MRASSCDALVQLPGYVVIALKTGKFKGDQMVDDARKAAALRTVSRFVLRARLVQEHSLAADKDTLKEHAAWTMSIRATQNLATGQRTVAMVRAPLLPTEQVESAAARVRPVFLFSDGVHYDKVLNALVEAAAASAVLNKEIEGLRAQFRAADPDYPKGRPTEARSGPSMTNKEVAGAWLYGQLLHEDELRRSYGAGISAEEMLLNATKTVCNEMLATVAALHMIERLVADRSLDLAEDLFIDPVSVTATEWAPQITGAYVADIGTAMPESLSEPLGSEWSEVHDLFDFGTTTPGSPGVSNPGTSEIRSSLNKL